MLRPALPPLFVLAVATGCRCGAGLSTHEASFVVEPSALELPATYVGAERVAALTVSNTSRAPLQLTLETDEPFRVSSTAVGLPGTGAERITVTFAPASPGTAETTVRVRSGAQVVEVAVRGRGLAPLTCDAGVCASRTFDPSLGACVEASRLPDGAPCVDACVADGQCVEGVCLGAASSACDDGNGCTSDGCTADGACVHVERQCDVEDPCLAAFCDPDAGCRAEAVDDGVPCGENTCATAKVCINGACVTRATPNWQQECAFTRIASDGTSTFCAVSQSERVRCWGSNWVERMGRGFPSAAVTPTLVPLSGANVTSLAVGPTAICVSTPSDVSCVPANNPLGALPPGELQLWPIATALESRGCSITGASGWCFNDGGLYAVSAGVPGSTLRTSPLWWCAFTDAGVWCGPAEGPLTALAPFPAPVVDVRVHVNPSAALVLLDDGSAWEVLTDGGRTRLVDAGATFIQAESIVSRSSENVLGRATGSGLTHLLGTNLGVVAAASTVFTTCVLTDGGATWCAGYNFSGELGRRDAQPLGVQMNPEPSPLWHAEGANTYVRRDGGFAMLGRQTTDDAGSVWLGPAVEPIPGELLDVGGDSAGTVGTPSVILDAQRRIFVRTDRTVREDAGLMLAHPPNFFSPTGAHCFARLNPASPIGCIDFDGLALPAPSAPAWVADPQALKHLLGAGPEALCAVGFDGGVWCSTPQTLTTTVGAIRELCSTHLLTAAGEVWSWSFGSVPARVSGLVTPVRALSCGLHFACAVSGANVVRCWGDNTNGQLGRDGPWSAQPVAVPMPEAVRAISSGTSHTCAEGSSGRLFCWGSNQHGALGVRALQFSPQLLQAVP
ncbi:MAG: hypothetical protein JNG84_05480 [Archangium sp.]|nr:hypothetical protein [Archangium sp.]